LDAVLGGLLDVLPRLLSAASQIQGEESETYGDGHKNSAECFEPWIWDVSRQIIRDRAFALSGHALRSLDLIPYRRFSLPLL
jgi:hypothetical protein